MLEGIDNGSPGGQAQRKKNIVKKKKKSRGSGFDRDGSRVEYLVEGEKRPEAIDLSRNRPENADRNSSAMPNATSSWRKEGDDVEAERGQHSRGLSKKAVQRGLE